MTKSNLMHDWAALVASLAIIALILTALGFMLGIVKPADAAKHTGAILGIAIALIMSPVVIANPWLDIPLWHRIVIAILAVGAWQWRASRTVKEIPPKIK